jgi:hypothetical protein
MSDEILGRPPAHGARRLLRLEADVWRSLIRWVLRRRPGQGPGVVAVPYAKDATPVLLAFLFVSVLELPVFHLLIPWEPVRIALLVVGVWGVGWTLGYLAMMRVFPHLVEERGLRVRQGPGVDLLVPWDAIGDVRAERDRVPKNTPVQFADEPAGRVAKVAILKVTRVRVSLREPLAVHGPDGVETVVALKLHADRPADLVAACAARLAGRDPAPGRAASAVP